MVDRGKFVVLEGIDGAGTTTQVARLASAIRARGGRVHTTREPSDGPIGTLIRQVLQGRFVLPGGKAPSWATMALLFAADRSDHIEAEIEPFLQSGGTVISDRYDASSLAYQSTVSGRGGAETIGWIRDVNRQVLRPDLTIVLEVTPEQAAARRESRGEPAQLYEQHGIQRTLATFYSRLEEHMNGDRVVKVDGGGGIDAVHASVVAAYDLLRGGRAAGLP